jgi:hypothetical protein
MKRMLASLALIGCSPRVDVLEIGSSDTTSGSTSTSTTTDASTTTTGPITGADDATSYNIINESDVGSGWQCDMWSQDCPPGEKCMPWASDGGGAWNSTRCSPVAPDPKQRGEPCTVVESGVSGIDDCDFGSMCWDVDPETNVGECVEICQGSEANPFCGEPCEFCNIASEGVLILCLPPCDPLEQDCAEGQACYPIVDTFACAPDVSGRTGAAGDVCEFINVCDPGLLCANPELVPDCGGASCCTPFCNVDTPDDCDAQLPGTVCTPWFEVGEYPEACVGSGVVGFCAVPQ